jgi:hypothetical protein
MGVMTPRLIAYTWGITNLLSLGVLMCYLTIELLRIN